MGNRALQVVTLLVALGVGAGAAFGVKAVRDASSQQASATTTPTPSPSPAAAATSSPTPSASPSPSPSPSPTPTPSKPAAAAAYPPQIQAGSTYNYSGRASLAAVASDSKDSGSSICAGITNTTQFIPSGYLAAYFVSVTFRDGQVLSSGYLRNGTTSNNFGQLQNRAGPPPNQVSSDPTGAGTHTYCLKRSGSAWVTTADGATVFSTNGESATSTAGATLSFESTIQQKSSNVVALAFVVPGFSSIAIDGSPPTQLIGSTQLF